MLTYCVCHLRSVFCLYEVSGAQSEEIILKELQNILQSMKTVVISHFIRTSVWNVFLLYDIMAKCTHLIRHGCLLLLVSKDFCCFYSYCNYVTNDLKTPSGVVFCSCQSKIIDICLWEPVFRWSDSEVPVCHKDRYMICIKPAFIIRTLPQLPLLFPFCLSPFFS